MYVFPNFKTKKQLKEALAKGEPVALYQPGPFGGQVPYNGKVTLEGPHFPEQHRWYAQGVIVNGKLTAIK